MSLFHSSVASITASLQTMVAKLEGHAARQRVLSDDHLKHASQLVFRANAAQAEAAQADRVREKLTSILD